MNNINGYCPHCKADLDGKLILDTFLDDVVPMETALEYASHYSGWEQHGKLNRYSRAIGIYDFDKDRTIAYQCPDCEEEF
jgi:hypothetical protein